LDAVIGELYSLVEILWLTCGATLTPLSNAYDFAKSKYSAEGCLADDYCGTFFHAWSLTVCWAGYG